MSRYLLYASHDDNVKSVTVTQNSEYLRFRLFEHVAI